ncbi:MAG: DUF423 domain-containing protein [Candidatus Omnitrophota bacterium]|nr:DUF423 domain-containing protein [Candidatus Omnitrophota bacterium]MDZ4242642.1 DUF423 domain-containing protein [Candidatus Omnitrophota bacterium]
MIWVKIASLLMFLAVALGAFGAHALRGKISDHYLDVYKTGVLYHLVHALGLFVVAWLGTVFQNPKVNLAGIFMLAGIILFSGSLYALAVTGQKWLGAVTPLGGVSFLISWLLILFIR